MQRKFLIIDDHDDLPAELSDVFTHTGHHVTTVRNRTDAVTAVDLNDFDIVITDLDVKAGADQSENVKAFKFSAANFRRDDFEEEELKNIVATVLDYKERFVDKADLDQRLHEN